MTVVEMLSLEEIVTSAPIINMLSLLSLLKKNGVKLLTETKLDSITAAGALVIDAQGQKQELAGDTVILSLGVIPDREAAARFDGLAAETYVIGDCAVSRGSIWTATTTAFDAAMEI